MPNTLVACRLNATAACLPTAWLPKAAAASMSTGTPVSSMKASHASTDWGRPKAATGTTRSTSRCRSAARAMSGVSDQLSGSTSTRTS